MKTKKVTTVYMETEYDKPYDGRMSTKLNKIPKGVFKNGSDEYDYRFNAVTKVPKGQNRIIVCLNYKDIVLRDWHVIIEGVTKSVPERFQGRVYMGVFYYINDFKPIKAAKPPPPPRKKPCHICQGGTRYICQVCRKRTCEEHLIVGFAEPENGKCPDCRMGDDYEAPSVKHFMGEGGGAGRPSPTDSMLHNRGE